MRAHFHQKSPESVYKSGFGETSKAPCSKCAVRSTRSMFYPVHARNVQVCCA